MLFLCMQPLNPCDEIIQSFVFIPSGDLPISGLDGFGPRFFCDFRSLCIFDRIDALGIGTPSSSAFFKVSLNCVFSRKSFIVDVSPLRTSLVEDLRPDSLLLPVFVYVGNLPRSDSLLLLLPLSVDDSSGLDSLLLDGRSIKDSLPSLFHRTLN
jgi:hypothetical protein